MELERAATHVPEVVIEDDDDEQYWQSIRRHVLSLQLCGACGRLRWPPAAYCDACSTRGGEWTPVTGHGVVLTWTVTRHAFLPAWADQVPYTVAVVELVEQDDLAIVGRLVGGRAEDVHAGMAVEVDFQDHPEGLTVAVWRPRRG